MKRLEKIIDASDQQDRADHEQGNRPDAWQIIAMVLISAMPRALKRVRSKIENSVRSKRACRPAE